MLNFSRCDRTQIFHSQKNTHLIKSQNSNPSSFFLVLIRDGTRCRSYEIRIDKLNFGLCFHAY